MTPPALAGSRFLWACLLGLGLGLWYGFLRPLRPRHTALADAAFLAAAAGCWVYFSFGICGGDLRLGYTAGLACGALGWELTAGRLLRPLFSRVWGAISLIVSIIGKPFRWCLKKIWNFQK